MTGARINAMTEMTLRDDKRKIKLSQAKIEQSRKLLKRAQAGGLSLRQIAKLLNGVITFQALGAFASGKYTPKSYEVCRVLEILADPKVIRIADQAPAELLWRLKNRTEMV